MQIYRYAWFADMPDPDDFLRPLFASDSTANFMRYRSGEVDRMLLKAAGAFDMEERVAGYRMIEEEIASSCPMIPLMYFGIDVVHRPNVQDYYLTALGAHTTRYHGVWLKKPLP
jgi:ABC-type oligopeptide transport system substrate-binding subunit